jgi:hypothetical protein
MPRLRHPAMLVLTEWRPIAAPTDLVRSTQEGLAGGIKDGYQERDL